tara:strand:- start:668 stop:1012 length:345 start_codon:yes stop_codon:yes gene_type:complete
MKIISNQDLRVATTWGAVILFQANVEKEVADEVGVLAIQMGATEVGKKAHKIEEPDETGEVDCLIDVMNQIIKAANPKDFKVNGVPKAAVVNKLAGRTVSTTEREAAWEKALNS